MNFLGKGIQGPIGEVTARLRVKRIGTYNSRFPTTEVELGPPHPQGLPDGPLLEASFTVAGVPLISSTDEYEITIRKVTK